jgi:hypothetical protein
MRERLGARVRAERGRTLRRLGSYFQATKANPKWPPLFQKDGMRTCVALV